jgi:AmiR/NasT family two-component response regulator
VLVNDQLQEALTSRVVIEQAKGYAAALSGTDPETAYQVIRRHARDNHRRIGEVARSVVSGEIDVSKTREDTA